MLTGKHDALSIVKQRLFSKKPVFGIVLRSAETAFAELAALSGFDFAWIDMEHGAFEIKDVESLIIVLENEGCVPLVRVPENNANVIGQVLDLGARIVDVPHIATARDAEAAVKAAKYFPGGRRGFSSCSRTNARGLRPLDPETMKEMNDQNLVMVQIESAEAVRNVDLIAGTRGVDIVFLGMGDLSQDLGCPGQYQNRDCVRAIEKTGEAIGKANKIGAISAESPEKIARYVALGFSLFVCGVDVLLMKDALRSLRDRLCRNIV